MQPLGLEQTTLEPRVRNFPSNHDHEASVKMTRCHRSNSFVYQEQREDELLEWENQETSYDK